jgi:DNA-binding NtrC family response regulator
MIRIGLYSEDRTLQSLLSSALGQEFEILRVAAEEGIKLMLSAGGCDVMLLELDSEQDALKQRLDCSRRIIASQIPLVVMASDALRSTAVDLVRQGAYGYCRRPPSIRDLKTMLLRANENSSLKRELDNVHQRLNDATSRSNRMIGSSPQMQQVYDLVNRVANINTSVLVTGESGTGQRHP